MTAKVESVQEVKTLKTLVDESGIKRNTVAEHLGIKRERLWGILNDPSRMSYDRMLQFSEILNVDIDTIIESIRSQTVK